MDAEFTRLALTASKKTRGKFVKVPMSLRPTRRNDRVPIELEAVCNLIDSKAEQILAIHEALAHLAEESPRAAELVKLRYFGGMTQQEAADCLGISRATAGRLWAYAKAALYCDLSEARG
jgi:DNA-directed RNA polymerase specialized sigma24 family protein